MDLPLLETSPSDPVTASLASMLSGCPTCRSWAEQDEGPYRRDTRPLRRDIVEDREGTPLQLGIRLTGADGTAVRGATVEIWQCDALGRYSGFSPPDDSVVATAETAPRGQYLSDQTFLRGSQHTDAAGVVEFRTIHPGWYPGRTVHIHVRVQVGDTTLTSQLYFPDHINDRVLAMSPYAERPDRDTTNDSDEIFSTGGEPAVVDITSDGEGHVAAICLVLPTAEVAS